MQLGDKVQRYISTRATKSAGGKQQQYPEEKVLRTGTVVYMHPKKTYYTVEFDVGGFYIRESYRRI